MMAGVRRRWTVAAAVAALVAAAVVVVLVLSQGGGPPTGAASLVPGDALLYVNVSTDPGRAEVKQAGVLARRFPDYLTLSSSLLSRVAAIVSGSASNDFERQVRPWLGGEAAFAALNTTSTTAGSLIILSVSNMARAQSFITRAGAKPAGSYRGVELRSYPTGTELAFLRGFLVLGQDAGVRAAIDVARAGAPALSANGAYQRAASGEPDDRVLDAYSSLGGIRRVLESRGGVIGGLGQLLDRPALQGVTVSLSPARSGVSLRLHSVFDPALVHGSARQFHPSLLSSIPSSATLALDTLGLRTLAPQVLAAGTTAGIGGGVAPLLARLGRALNAEGVNVSQLLSVFGGETALALVPQAGGGRPTLVIVAPTSNPSATTTMLANLEAPLSQLFAPPSAGPGQAPVFNDRQIAGVTAHQLELAPGLELDYAVFGHLVVVATGLPAIAAVAAHKSSIQDSPQFKTALPAVPDQATSLLYFDFSQLLHLSEQTGITRGATLQALAPDLQRIRAVGLNSTGGEADTTAELFLQIP